MRFIRGIRQITLLLGLFTWFGVIGIQTWA
jgi:hypothetical protein